MNLQGLITQQIMTAVAIGLSVGGVAGIIAFFVSLYVQGSSNAL